MRKIKILLLVMLLGGCGENTQAQKNAEAKADAEIKAKAFKEALDREFESERIPSNQIKIRGALTLVEMAQNHHFGKHGTYADFADLKKAGFVDPGLIENRDDYSGFQLVELAGDRWDKKIHWQLVAVPLSKDSGETMYMIQKSDKKKVVWERPKGTLPEIFVENPKTAGWKKFQQD